MRCCAGNCTYSLRAGAAKPINPLPKPHVRRGTLSPADLSKTARPGKRVWGRKCQAAAVPVDIAESARALLATSLRAHAHAHGLRVVSEVAGCVRELRCSDARLAVADVSMTRS